MNASYKIARSQVALIDLGNEGRIRVSGADAEKALNACFSMDLEIILPWKGVTGLFLNEQASVLAVATVFKGDDEFFIFTEVATSEILLRHLGEKLSSAAVEIEDLSTQYGWICALGPKAQNAMSEFAGEDILGLPYLAFEENVKLDAKLFRMGFSGEFEYRILCPLDRCQEMKATMLNGGQEFGLEVVQPEVLSLLMLEMRSLGIADIPSDVDPIQAGLHWMVNFRKEAYFGHQAVLEAKSNPRRRALMLRLAEKGVAAAGDRIEIEGQDFGFLVHVDYSPTLESDIALAYADPAFGRVGVTFETKGKERGCMATGVSAPLFVTKTVSGA